MRRNWLVLLMVCLAVVMMAVLPGCRSKKPSGGGPSTAIGKAGTYTFKLADLAWEKVEEPANENMSKMMVYAAGEENPNAIETDAEATDPDFSKVSGGGLYIESAHNLDGSLDLRAIKWSGAGAEVDETFDENEARDPDATAMIKNGATRLAVSVDSELGWIAYNPDYAAEDAGEGEFAQMDKYYGGRIKFYGAVGDYSGIAEGTYAYTMFAKDPTAGEVPEIDTELDMTSGSVTMVFASEASPWPVLIKLLIRDANGDWYLGGVQEDLPDPTPTPPPVEQEDPLENSNTAAAFVADANGSFDVDFADLAWEQVDSDLASLLNTMEGYDGYENSPFAMVIDPDSTTPDLSAVTGGGLFVNSSSDPTSELCISGLKWAGNVEIDEPFPQEEHPWSPIVEHKQHSNIQPSPITGFGWGAYTPLVAENNSICMDHHWSGRIQIYDGANIGGSYIYTIFDESGGNSATETVNMTAGTLTVSFSGPGTCYPQGFKILVRDADDDWYLGGLLTE